MVYCLPSSVYGKSIIEWPIDFSLKFKSLSQYFSHVVTTNVAQRVLPSISHLSKLEITSNSKGNKLPEMKIEKGSSSSVIKNLTKWVKDKTFDSYMIVFMPHDHKVLSSNPTLMLYV